MRVLTADVGGTNTRVAICGSHDLRPETVRRYRNAEFESLAAVLRHYRAETGAAPCDAACAAVAGPVREGRGRLTNLDWEIDAGTLCAAGGVPQGFVINDLEAQGHAIAHVPTRFLHGAAAPDPAGTRLVVGLGTGFNAAPVHRTASGGLHVAVSECGHVSLPVWDEASFALAAHLRARHGFASVEEVLSGRGLLALHRFLAAPGDPQAADTAAVIAALTEPARPGDADAGAMFCGLLGRVLGDLALIHLPWGGMFLIGGLARAVAPLLDRYGFPDSFTDKGRFRDFMGDFGIFLVEDDFSALSGCAEYARSAMPA